jgi:hypothetical protein
VTPSSAPVGGGGYSPRSVSLKPSPRSARPARARSFANRPGSVRGCRALERDVVPRRLSMADAVSSLLLGTKGSADGVQPCVLHDRLLAVCSFD